MWARSTAWGRQHGPKVAGLHDGLLTEQELFEYLLYDQELPVTRRTIHYAVIRREIVPTRLGNGNYFSKRDGLEWIRSRKRGRAATSPSRKPPNTWA